MTSIIADADFAFVSSNHERFMLKSAYDTITINEGWDLLKNFQGKNFMFDAGKKINALMTKINTAYGDNHSGCSIACTMRVMEYIANNGYEKYKEENIIELSNISVNDISVNLVEFVDNLIEPVESESEDIN